jgi:hypothetical protein
MLMRMGVKSGGEEGGAEEGRKVRAGGIDGDEVRRYDQDEHRPA